MFIKPDLCRALLNTLSGPGLAVRHLSQARYDVVVVGGGIMGSSTAHWLASRREGLKIGRCHVNQDIPLTL
jgi:NADPH-dependent 2,4-dienoyl-CoA reductase/sulfur reductase-like enzyme